MRQLILEKDNLILKQARMPTLKKKKKKKKKKRPPPKKNPFGSENVIVM